MNHDIQLLGISNAIVDVLTHVDHDFLDAIGAEPGSMTLIDKDRANEVYNMMGPATEMSGGSVANTVAGFANLGGSAAYIGKVRNDQLGRIFNHDMKSLGVDIRLPRAENGAPTARSHVLITDDGQRTMQTYLGACLELGLADITPGTVGAPDAILIEGYVWDIAEGPDLARRAVEIARGNGTAVASFVMATSEVWSRKSSDQEKRTEWHRVVAWARLAEIASSYLKKGSLVYVEGRLQTCLLYTSDAADDSVYV